MFSLGKVVKAVLSAGLISLLPTAALAVVQDKQLPVLEVIAVEYPPFTSEQQQDQGSNFAALRHYLAARGVRLEVAPRFLPSARAQTEMIDGNWCASFYPPPDGVKLQAGFVALGEQRVALGLYRKAMPEPFVWQSLTELGGGTVAVLRSRVDGGFIRQFTDAGLSLEYINDIGYGLKMLLRDRVDYAFGDSEALSRAKMPESERNQLQFSQTLLMEVPIGIFINPKCTDATSLGL